MREHRIMNRRTMAMYILLLIAAVGVFLLGWIYDVPGDVIISAPIIVVLIITMFYDKKIVHIPPALVFLVVAVMYFSLLTNILDGGPLLKTLQSVLVGIVIGLVGLIVVYMLLGQLPGFNRERPGLVSVVVFTFGIATYTIWRMIEYYVLGAIVDDYSMKMDEFMMSLFWVSIGSLFIALMFFAGRSTRFFDETVVRFLKRNSDAIGIQQPKSDQEAINDIIGDGETEHVEFKSTLRTNLVTGEKDKRMERSVLKTIVAFLNTEGGTLLIGVSDDGKISGIDIESFESRDKMNLHMTNLISSQIGNEFLPHIDFRLVDFENVCVMRVDCVPIFKPVFLKDNKIETYFVRSGPSSVELTGMDLLNYVNNRNKKNKKEN